MEEEVSAPEIKFIPVPVTEKIAEALLSDIEELLSLQINDDIYRLEIDDELPPHVLEIAKNELRETPGRMQESQKLLRQLLKGEENLVAPVFKDSWLIRFLRPCKYYPESAFELIKRHYRFKIKHPYLYRGLKPSNEKKTFEQNILVFQKERDQFGRRVVIVDLGRKWNPSQVTLDEFLKGLILLLELGILEPQTQICGVVIILDMEGFSLGQATRFTPAFAKRLIDWIQDCAPVRLKNIHVVNQSYFFKIVLKLFRQFLNDKLKQRLIIHGNDLESLHKYVRRECLPQRYGGTANIFDEIDGSIWSKILLKCDREYEVINQYGYSTK